jgi:flagellar assembly protein FliH
MSSSPEPRRLIPPPHPRVLRDGDAAARAATLEPVEALLYTMDGRPVTAEVQAATDAGFRKGWDVGWRDGFSVGRDAGRDQAYEEFRAALAPAVTALLRATEEIERQDRTTLTQLEDVAVALVYDLVESLLGRELELAEAPARDSLARALALAPDRGAVVVRLHPDDLDAIAAVAAETAPGRAIELVADGSVERGGCVVEVGACRVDAQLGPALERARGVLSASRPRRHRGDA